MPRTLQDDLAADLERTFFDTSRFAEACTYLQGAAAPVPVAGIVSLAEYEIVQAESFPQKVARYDWSIPVGDLAGVLPRNGDRITRTSDGAVFEAQPVGQRPAVEVDEMGLAYLIHTKQIS